jgi:HK97 family phage prohead protease
MSKITKIFKAEIKSVDETNHTVEAIVSTNKVDRDGDIILPEAFKDKLKLYKAHPVLLTSHNYYQLMSQIGEAESVKITDIGLEVKFKYYVGEGNVEADWGWNLARKGIAAFSIGFMGLDYEWIKGENELITGRKYLQVELLEISQVLVPSNRGALQVDSYQDEVEKEICELVIKGFENGDLKEAKKEEKKEEKPFPLSKSWKYYNSY